MTALCHTHQPIVVNSKQNNSEEDFRLFVVTSGAFSIDGVIRTVAIWILCIHLFLCVRMRVFNMMLYRRLVGILKPAVWTLVKE